MISIPAEGNKKEYDIRTVLDKVRKKYPEVNGYIHVLYYNTFDFTTVVMLHKTPGVCPPVMQVSERWCQMSEEKKEAVMAHELAHIIHYEKNPNPKRMSRFYRISVNFHLMLDGKKGYKLGEDPKMDRFLEKYRTLFEIYADTEAVRRGYGDGMLAFLQEEDILEEVAHLKGTPQYEICQRMKEARIKNLENIVGK